MKIAAGPEAYHPDPDSYIYAPAKSWWRELDPRIRQEPTHIKHSSFWTFLLGKIFSAIDWLPRLLGIARPHYKQVQKNRSRILAERDQWEFYKRLAEHQDPHLVFQKPLPPNSKSVRSKVVSKLKDGDITHVKFISTFEPINSHYRESYWQHHLHKDIPMEIWRHHGGPRPTVIALHGYNGSVYAFNRFAFSVKDLYAAGCNICLIKLPFHRGKPRSQKDVINIFGHGPSYSNEVIANAVHDVRAAMNYLFDNRIANEIAITGGSFGGFVAALVTSVDERLSASILLEPLVNLPDVLLEWFPLRALFEQIREEENISEVEFKQIYAPIVALTYKPAIEKHRLLLISGMYDIIASPRHVKLLGEHWGQCKLIWKDASHLGHQSAKPYLKETLAHLQSINFI